MSGYSSSLEIRILGDTPQRKGKTFENLIRIILEKLNYADFMSPVSTTGMEFDIMTRDKKTQEPVLCECKAHEDQIDTGDLLKFFGKLCHERSNNKALKGVFFSTSGFNGTALKNYEELSNEDKQVFRIYGNEAIVELLRNSNIFVSNEELDRKIKQKIVYPLGERYLVFYESDFYVVQLVRIGGQPRNFAVFTAEGDLVEHSIRKKIKDLDHKVGSLQEIDLMTIDEVALDLLDLKPKSVYDISAEINATSRDVQVALEELQLEGLIDSDKINEAQISYRVVANIEGLIKLAAKLMTDKDKKIRFIYSKYLESIINDNFVDFLANRFKLILDEHQRKYLMKITKLFPSVLYAELFRQNVDFENNYKQIEDSVVPPDEKIRQHKNMVRYFRGQILSIIRDDLYTLAPIYLQNKGIRAYAIESRIKLVSDIEPILDEVDQSSGYIAAAGGTIEPGQLVMGDIDAITNMGHACMLLKDYQNAKSYFEKATYLTTDIPAIKAAWNNIGVCFMRLHKWEEAIPCFKKVPSIDQGDTIASKNLNECIEILKLTFERMKVTINAVKRLIDENC
jgi:tetratricopeptide (TPR) repeat protein